MHLMRLLEERMKTIYEIYRERCHQNGDLNEHLPLLYMLSLKSAAVVEFGVARGISASALIAGQDARQGVRFYRGYDPTGESAEEIKRLELACLNKTAVQFIQQRSTEARPIFPPADLLFIDSLHTEETLREELHRHLEHVKRYVVLHDTVTFGETGETPGTRGLHYAMNPLRDRDCWQEIYDSPRNNGLLVFERVK